MNEQQTAFNQAADLLDELPLWLRTVRKQRNLSVRAAGAQIGITGSWLARIEHGERCMAYVAVAILRWMAREDK